MRDLSKYFLNYPENNFETRDDSIEMREVLLPKYVKQLKKIWFSMTYTGGW